MTAETAAERCLRGAIALVFLAFGYVKFFPFEAVAVAPLIAAQPLLSWLEPSFGQDGASAFLGVIEIGAGLLLIAGYFSVKAGIAGAALTVVTFFVTATLLAFVPGVFEASAGGFPAISATGGFLLKDIVLLAVGLLFLEKGLRARLQAPART